jgi:tetratricopeptide (TPR) repeat protein
VPVFVVAFVALAVGGYWETSATWDEPIHLTAGYVALTSRDFRVDPSHPPLLRMWAALPVLAMGPIHADTRIIDASAPRAWLQDAYGFAHQFMYRDNDADRMLGAARMMVVMLGVLLGILVFCWAREWLGLVPAAAALVLFALEPNLMAHASLVTTDLGVTTFVFGTVYFLWRTCRHVTRFNVIALAGFCGLAMAAKFSAILLAPVVVLLLALAVVRLGMPGRVACAIAALLAVASVGTIWASYGFKYLPSESPAWVFDFARTDLAARAPAIAAAVGWVDGYHLLPNAYAQGFLYTQVSSQQMPAFLAGSHSASGWWYYFPIAFLIKTPIALILLLACGVAVCVARRRSWGGGPLAFIAVPVIVYLAVAMSSGINIGLRHILPIYPFVLLIAAAAAKALLETRSRLGPAALALMLVAGAAEFADAYPHTLPFFNRLVGGSDNGFRYLVDSNLGWGRNLKPLKAWMDEQGVSHINLAYFGQADPAYYGIHTTHLPGAPGFAIDDISRPRLPGYVAISPTILQGVYAPPHWRLFYQPFQDLEPAVIIGDSLRVYWLERWPEAVGAAGGTADGDAHRVLGDALLFGLQWPERASLHYREHLQRRPRDADALMNLGIALVMSGRVDDALPAFHRAVDARPDHGPARLTLARALFGGGDLPGAAAHAEAAVRLLPDDPDAHDFLGRTRAAQGRFDEAAVEFRRALQIDPSHTEARANLGRLSGGRP